MNTFALRQVTEDFATLTLVREDREFAILAAIRIEPGAYRRVMDFCHCTVTGMDIAKCQSRTFRIEIEDELRKRI